MSRSDKILCFVVLGILSLAGIAVVIIMTTTNKAASPSMPWSTSTSPAKTSFRALLTMTVNPGAHSGCSSGGYSDIREGTQVEIVNQRNEVVALGTLHRISGDCSFSTSIDDIPTGENMYGAKLGNANRGVIWKKEGEVRSEGWALTLGE
jgi:hypothetical protein